VLVLSILIMLALAVAVASFFIATAQWLLFASAALVLLAFYLSRRASRSILDASTGPDSAPALPVRKRLTVTIDNEILESGRHRNQPGIDHPAEDTRPTNDSGRIAR
jgi:hypothetical protein